MEFKKAAIEDLDTVFFDTAEFGEIHRVGDKEMVVIVDNMEIIERSKKQASEGRIDGIYKKQLLFYVKRSDFGRAPAIGSELRFDGNPYIVTDVVEEGGTYSIMLGANKS